MDQAEILFASEAEGKGAVGTSLPLTVYNPLEALISSYQDERSGVEQISAYASDKHGLFTYFISGNGSKVYGGGLNSVALFDLKGALASLNAHYWSKALALTDVLEVMSADKRNEWHTMISEDKTPDFDRETVVLTVQSLLLNRDQFFAEKVDAVFRSLSRNHVTNSPGGFSKRMILEWMLDRYGFMDHRRCEYIQDLRAVVAKLIGRETPCSQSTYQDLSRLSREGSYGQWIDLDGGAIRVKLFKKGTAHLEVHPEIAWRLNKVLAFLYPAAIPSELRTKPAKPPKDHVLREDLLPVDVLRAIASSLEDSRYFKDHRIYHSAPLKDDVLKGFSQVMQYIGGVPSPMRNSLSWVFSYDPKEVLHEIARNGCLPEQVSHQYYATHEELAREVVDLAGVQEGEAVLEPSAGIGGLADFLPLDQTTCVEISDVHAAVLRAKGFDTHQKDFLRWNPGRKFQKVVMNPPFSNGRAAEHLRHAAGMLADSGRLVAVLPASLVGKELVAGMKHTWGPRREGGFADTKVWVSLLVLEP